MASFPLENINLHADDGAPMTAHKASATIYAHGADMVLSAWSTVRRPDGDYQRRTITIKDQHGAVHHIYLFRDVPARAERDPYELNGPLGPRTGY
jgi:hypothetical protein